MEIGIIGVETVSLRHLLVARNDDVRRPRTVGNGMINVPSPPSGTSLTGWVGMTRMQMRRGSPGRQG